MSDNNSYETTIMAEVQRRLHDHRAAEGAPSWLRAALLYLLWPDEFHAPDDITAVFPGIAADLGEWGSVLAVPVWLSEDQVGEEPPAVPIAEEPPETIDVSTLPEPLGEPIGPFDEPMPLGPDDFGGDDFGAFADALIAAADNSDEWAVDGDGPFDDNDVEATSDPVNPLAVEIQRLREELAALAAKSAPPADLVGRVPGPSEAATPVRKSHQIDTMDAGRWFPDLRPLSDRWAPHPRDRQGSMPATFDYYKAQGAAFLAKPLSAGQVHGEAGRTRGLTQRSMYPGWPMEAPVFVVPRGTPPTPDPIGPVSIVHPPSHPDVELHVVLDPETKRAGKMLSVAGVSLLGERFRLSEERRQQRESLARDAEEMANA